MLALLSVPRSFAGHRGDRRAAWGVPQAEHARRAAVPPAPAAVALRALSSSETGASCAGDAVRAPVRRGVAERRRREGRGA